MIIYLLPAMIDIVKKDHRKFVLNLTVRRGALALKPWSCIYNSRSLLVIHDSLIM